MDKLTNPHDKYFRSSMSDLRVAKDFLQAHLPEKIRNIIQWDTIRLAPSHYVDRHLAETMTDILYQVKFKEEQGYITILVEHQSKPDPLMAFRVLCYSISIMRRYQKEHPKKTLPLVVPLVFYSGQAPYNYTTDVFKLFGSLESQARDTFMNPFQLVDLARIPDKQLRQHTWASVMELVQKHIFVKDFMPVIKALVPLLRELDNLGGEDYIYGTLKYITNTAELGDSGEFSEIINNDAPKESGEISMTLLEMWLEEGRQEGEKKAQKLMMQKMLAQGADPVFVSKVTGFAVEELELHAEPPIA